MGFLSRLFGGNGGVPENGPSTSDPRHAGFSIDLEFSGPVFGDLVKLSGTTTVGRDAMTALLNRSGVQVGSGMLLLHGALQREPTNSVDANAIAVHVEGERVAYVPRYVADALDLGEGSSRVVAVQIFYLRKPGEDRVEAWAWLGAGDPAWEFDADSPPPLTAAAKRKAHSARTDSMIEDALREGGTRAAQFRAGAVDGIHYLQTIEPIQQLKRDGRLDEALALCYTAIAGAENGREGREPAPWYTEQAAIIHRKLGQRDEEIAVLRRWLRYAPGSTGKLAERLAKLLASES